MNWSRPRVWRCRSAWSSTNTSAHSDEPLHLVRQTSANQGGGDHHALSVQHREPAVARQRMNSRPITTVPRLDMDHRLFAILREGQPGDAIDRDPAAVGTRTVLGGAVQGPFEEKRPARRAAGAGIP